MNEKSDIQLLRQCVRFLGNPLDLAHQSRVTELLAPFDQATLRACPAAWKRLGSYAVSRWELSSPQGNLLDCQASLFLLASPEQALIIADWLGTLAAYDVIRQTICGKVLKSLHEALPHCFPAVHRQITHFQPWLKSLTQTWDASSPLDAEHIRHKGLSLLSQILGSCAPMEFISRWSLQFPVTAIEAAAGASVWQVPSGCTGLDLLHELRNRGLILC